MIRKGILNPHLSSLLCRVRHTNMLVIADRGFPNWPAIETVDISLTDGIPTVLQVFDVIRANFDIACIYMAEEFEKENTTEAKRRLARSTSDIPVIFEPHAHMKRRVPKAVGLIRTGDTTQYANMILVSGRPDRKLTAEAQRTQRKTRGSDNDSDGRQRHAAFQADV